jgi:hypothetical protein
MSDNHLKTKLKPQHAPASELQAGKLGLLLRFVTFMGWVLILGLFISLVACQQSEPIIFVIRVGSL